MVEYPHIDSIYKRDERGNFIIGDYAKPEFEYLKDLIWIWTEKVDGTNIRLMWDEQGLRFGGKTEKAQIPTKLLNNLDAHDLTERLAEVFDVGPACLYGEGHGKGIQKGGENYSLDQRFVLFDIRIGRWWLKRDNMEEIAAKLDLQIVPIVFVGTIDDAIAVVADGFKSSWGDFKAEGMVGQPEIPLLDRSGQRIIVKVKTKDFR